MAVEAIARQKDRETTAANIAKLSGAGEREIVKFDVFRVFRK